MSARLAVGLVGALLGVAVSACGGDDPKGAAATWQPEDVDQIDATATDFTALVSRLGCSGGETGDVQAPRIDYRDAEVVVTFVVLPVVEGAGTCELGPPVAYDVHLAEPVGDRLLVDGECRGDDGAATTAFCDPDEVRYRP